jgi:membrane protease YdiL (CAAX protease family)
MVIMFGLFHAPGLVLRGASAFEGMTQAPSPLYAIAYSIAIMGTAGLPFAILWARTGNLWLCMLPHAAIDTIAHLPAFIRLWNL